MTLSASGFSRDRLLEIKADYDARFTAALGPVNTSPDAVVGQIIGIFSAALDDVWESLQNTYDAMYPFSAEGTSLDGAVAFVGLERFAAAPTTVVAMCYGAESTEVPAGALARALDNQQYSADAATAITRYSTGDMTIKVMSLQTGTDYTVMLAGVNYTYTMALGDGFLEILNGLAAVIDPTIYVTEVDDVTLNYPTLRIYHVTRTEGFNSSLSINLIATRLGSPVPFTCITTGEVTLPANSLTTIDTSIVGWGEIDNLIAGSTGRDVETDEELRRRHAQMQNIMGSATQSAIQSRLLNEVSGVTSASVYENRSMYPQGSMPPHSIECVVQGGTDQAVGDKVFYEKAAGIETYGNVSVNVVDPNGETMICKFSRPIPVYTWVQVTVTEFYTEESLTTDAAQAINDAVLAAGATLGVGEDVIVQRLYGPVYVATNGIGAITVEVAKTTLPTDVPVWQTTNLPMDRYEIATFDATRVLVVGV